MLLNFNEIIKKYGLKIRGIVQVGAHYGQEVPMYAARGIMDLVLIEPCKAAFKKLKELYGKSSTVTLYNVACGAGEGRLSMYTESKNQGQSNSLLKPKLHLQQHSDIIFDSREEVNVVPLDSLEFDRAKYNMLNMDCQGYELHVLEGAVDTLQHIDYIFTEVNRGEMYEGCALIEDVDKFLAPYFSRAETGWASPTHGWGDSFYIRKELL